MWVAILYDDQALPLAAAPACDQLPMGDRYWQECFAGSLAADQSEAEIAYRWIGDSQLRRQLFLLGVDQTVDARALAVRVDALEMIAGSDDPTLSATSPVAGRRPEAA